MVVMAVVEKGAAAVAVATSPAWGPAVVEVLGLSIPVASTLLSILGVVLARLVVGAREGWKAGDIALTGALCLIAFALVTELRPGPGVAVACPHHSESTITLSGPAFDCRSQFGAEDGF
jgi:hypothetical protein